MNNYTLPLKIEQYNKQLSSDYFMVSDMGYDPDNNISYAIVAEWNYETNDKTTILNKAKTFCIAGELIDFVIDNFSELPYDSQCRLKKILDKLDGDDLLVKDKKKEVSESLFENV